MIKPDYDVGDEVVYVGPDSLSHLVGPGPHFCARAEVPTAPCKGHGFACKAVYVTGAPVPRPHDGWCCTRWRKAPTRPEQAKRQETAKEPA